MTHHSLDIRVYYEDTDAGGVVYHSNYLNFAERGRTEFLRALGHQNSDLEKEHSILFLVRHIDIEYHKPAVLDDHLRLETSIETLKNTSFVMRQEVFRGNEILTGMHVALVCVDTNTKKPVKLPDVVKSEFKKYIE